MSISWVQVPQAGEMEAEFPLRVAACSVILQQVLFLIACGSDLEVL